MQRTHTLIMKMLLPVILGGSGAIEVAGAEVRTTEIYIDSFKEVIDMTAFPEFSSFYLYPLEAPGPGLRSDSLVLLGGFSTVTETVPAEDDEEDDTYRTVNFGQYATATDSVTQSPERGFFAFRTEDESLTIGSNAVGFLRVERPLIEVETRTVAGLFTGASGLMDWTYMSTDRSTWLEMDYALEGVPYYREISSSYTPTTGGLTMAGFSFPVSDETTLVEWSFGSSFLTHFGDGVFAGLARRSDAHDNEDLEDWVVFDTNIETLWNIYYVMSLYAPGDVDQDQVPDILETSVGNTVMPWYADVYTPTSWYWSTFLNLWVYADRYSEWDYWQSFGWAYVENTGSLDTFYFHAPQISSSWLFSSEDVYPMAYDTGSGDWLYLYPVDHDTGSVYSSSADSWRMIEL